MNAKKLIVEIRRAIKESGTSETVPVITILPEYDEQEVSAVRYSVKNNRIELILS